MNTGGRGIQAFERGGGNPEGSGPLDNIPGGRTSLGSVSMGLLECKHMYEAQGRPGTWVRGVRWGSVSRVEAAPDRTPGDSGSRGPVAVGRGAEGGGC